MDIPKKNSYLNCNGTTGLPISSAKLRCAIFLSLLLLLCNNVIGYLLKKLQTVNFSRFHLSILTHIVLAHSLKFHIINTLYSLSHHH